MSQLPAVLFHALPVVPLVMGRLGLLAAAVLLVALPYIKVAKLRGQRRDLQSRHPDPHPVQLEGEASLTRAIRRWEYLTLAPVRRFVLPRDEKP